MPTPKFATEPRILAGAVAERLAVFAGRLVDQRHDGIGHGGPGVVGDDSTHAALEGLGVQAESAPRKSVMALDRKLILDIMTSYCACITSR